MLVGEQSSMLELCHTWRMNSVTQTIDPCHWVQQRCDGQMASTVKNPEFWISGVAAVESQRKFD